MNHHHTPASPPAGTSAGATAAPAALSDDDILQLAHQCGLVTGSRLRKTDGHHYYRSLGTPSNVRDSALMKLVHAAMAAASARAAQPATAAAAVLPAAQQQAIAQRFVARIFSGRKGHGGGPVSYMQITQEELTSIVAGALTLASSVRQGQPTAVAPLAGQSH